MSQSLASFAKINLFLHITGKRLDGYHDLFSLMTKIRLADTMTFTFHGTGVTVTCDHPMVPEDETNLAHRAATLFFRSCEKQKKNISVPGVSIDIQKHIPVGGGLGGGSSNAATVLSALNARCHDPFSRNVLMEMGQQLGADVPFFLYGKAALATGKGETLNRVPKPIPRHVVVCDPGIAVSTARVFQNHDLCLTFSKEYTIETASNILSAGQDVDIRPYLHNDLEAATFRVYPEVRVARDQIAQLLQRRVLMSGSGGSLFALFSGEKNARHGYDRLLAHWAVGKKRVFLTALQQG
ncbi:MAG: 4-(cytidine 5'-diphospho)-2-C-methyl-D-erythritol kinase [Desulfotignum sp.]|nr:4-(cytidine 5'-diphospho)-2-C-methyl-D-erythritol kinase [Desulfotignum sp.]MCF8088285.1 4-(cytidine 5'-diphospho)-2-C-methyl-D-erythritol kinase [Desulfotignum sp.]MCF8135962.1 4-(cytidine 5'-diphospho)-2-C-methyl-D-erythritol kinase [Desulfotignum sp.]